MIAEQHEHQATPVYRFVDDDHAVAMAREQVREQAWETIEARRAHPERVDAYIPVDALSTAHSVLAVEQTHGVHSQAFDEHLGGLRLDCGRLLAEWYRKNRPEFFPALRHHYDEYSGEFYSHGLSIRQMTENALVPIRNNHEEEARRVNERVEEETVPILRSLGRLALGEGIRTISECTDKALSDYAADMQAGRPEGSYDGYVPQIAKNMFRDVYVDMQTGDRLEVQASTPGLYHTHEIIQMTLARHGAIGASHMDKTRLHGAQMIVSDRLMDFIARLDEVASEQWCTNVFMGEEVPPDFTKDYEAFEQEALDRQEQLSAQTEVLTGFVLDLARQNYDRHKAPEVVEGFVKHMLLDLGKRDITAAEQMFNKETALGLQEVAWLEEQGLWEQAEARMAAVQKAAPGGGACGMGCGIETVNMLSKEGRELSTQLKARAGDVVARDKERACVSCKKVGTVTYAYTSSKVNKFCTSCKSFKSEQTTGRKKQRSYTLVA